MSQPIIQIQHLNKTFGTGPTAVHALEDINLEIEAGEIFGIIGLSGAGKSTLVRCMNLLERPTTGSVLVDGKDLTKLRDKQLRQARQDISMIFQSFNLLMQRTCIKNICFPLELAGVKRSDALKRARELLEIVGLPDKANAYPAQLSGGQQQRIAIARALATDPKVLLCDEATSALDPKTTHSILELIRDINKKTGITVIIITHQMSVVEEICNNVAILDNGEVVECGAVSQVFASPKSDAAKRLVFPERADEVIPDVPGERRVKVVFNGAAAANTPLIARMAKEIGVEANILGASTKAIGGKAYGYILLGIPGGDAEVRRTVEYLQAVKDVIAEEV